MKTAPMTTPLTEVMTRPASHLGGMFDWDPFTSVFPDVARWFGGRRSIAPIRVEEEVVDDVLHVRAEVPGIDPDKDADVSLADGRLTIKVERRTQEKEEKDGVYRTEFRYGSMMRTITVPEGLDPDAVTATYTDGILDIAVPPPKARTVAPTKVTVQRG